LRPIWNDWEITVAKALPVEKRVAAGSANPPMKWKNSAPAEERAGGTA